MNVGLVGYMQATKGVGATFKRFHHFAFLAHKLPAILSLIETLP